MKNFYYFILVAMLMVTSTASAQKDTEHPWAGSYTVMLIDDEPMHYLPETAAEWITSVPDTFEVAIEWNAEQGKYLVTKFYNYTTNNIEDGGLELKVIDEKKAQIIPVKGCYHKFTMLPAEQVITEKVNDDGKVVKDTADYSETVIGLELCDGGSSMYSYEPIEVTMNSDGQISIDAFKILYQYREGTGWFVWTDGATPLNGGDEKEDVVPYDWTGYYWITVDPFSIFALDGNEYPTEGAMEIAKDASGNFIVTKFLGYDTASANAFTGGIYLTPSTKKANVATIDCSEYMNILNTTDDLGMSGLVLCDAMGGNGSINIEIDESTNTVSIDVFYLVNWDGMTATSEQAAMYFMADALKGDATAVKTPAIASTPSTEMYDLTGRRITAPRKGQFVIANGKKHICK